MNLLLGCGACHNGVGDGCHLSLHYGSVLAINANNVNYLTHINLEERTLCSLVDLSAELLRICRVGQYTQLAAQLCGCAILRELHCHSSEVCATLSSSHQAVSLSGVLSQNDIAYANRVGHRANVSYARDVIYIVFEYGTINLRAILAECDSSHLSRQSLTRVVSLVDSLTALALSVDHRLLGCSELSGHLLHLVSSSQTIVLGRLNLEYYVRNRTRGNLLEHLLVLVVELLDVSLLDLHERVSYLRVVLTNPATRECLVSSGNTCCDLQVVHEYALRNQTYILLHRALNQSVVNQHLVALHHQRAILLVSSGSVQVVHNLLGREHTGLRVGECRNDDGRYILTRDQLDTLIVANVDTHLVEAGLDSVLVEQLLPSHIVDSVLSLARRVVLAAHCAQVVLHCVEGILIVGVGDFLTVDFSDFGILLTHTAVLKCQ